MQNSTHLPLSLPLTYNNATVLESPNKAQFQELAKRKTTPAAIHVQNFNESGSYEIGEYVNPRSVYEYLCVAIKAQNTPPQIAALDDEDSCEWHQVAVVGIHSYKRQREKLTGKTDEDGNVIEQVRPKILYSRPYYHVLHKKDPHAPRSTDLKLLSNNDLSFIQFYTQKHKFPSITTKIDDVAALYLHNHYLKCYPKLPEFSKANCQLALFFKVNSWKKFTLDNDIDSICVDAVEFITKYIVNNPRNSLHQENANDLGISSKAYSDFTRSRISFITSFVSWTHYQQKDYATRPRFYMMHCFTAENMQAYDNFQLDALGKKLLTQSTYFKNMFEAFQFVCKALTTWIPALDLTRSQKDFFINTNNRTLQWLKTKVTQVHFKDKIWTNMSKQADYLQTANLTITVEEIHTVERTCIEIITLLHTLWIDMQENADTRELLWDIRGYHVMESHLWMVLLHMWMFGIRPSSLLQVSKSNFLCQYAGPDKFTLSFQFSGFDKSQYGGVDRRIGFAKMTKEFLFYINERLPLAHTRYHRDKDDPCLFLSTTGLYMTKDQMTSIFKKVYGAILNKYACPRLVRFWLGHYSYQAVKDNDAQLLKVCYLFNHSISTHLRYYVCSDKLVEHDPGQDTDLFNTIFSQ